MGSLEKRVESQPFPSAFTCSQTRHVGSTFDCNRNTTQVKPPYHPPYIYSEPEIQSKRLDPNDRFVLLATDGLWDHMTNSDIIEIMQDVLVSSTGDEPVVENIPSRLVHLALNRAAEAHNVRHVLNPRCPPARETAVAVITSLGSTASLGLVKCTRSGVVPFFFPRTKPISSPPQQSDTRRGPTSWAEWPFAAQMGSITEPRDSPNEPHASPPAGFPISIP